MAKRTKAGVSLGLLILLVHKARMLKAYGILVKLAVSSLQNLTSSVSVATMSLK